jgi:hypothetical protein
VAYRLVDRYKYFEKPASSMFRLFYLSDGGSKFLGNSD